MLANMKKVALSLSVIVLFALYSLQRHAIFPGQSNDAALVVSTSVSENSATVQPNVRATITFSDSPPSGSTQTVGRSAQKSSVSLGPDSTATSVSATDVPAAESTSTGGQYIDGTYTGPESDANWGLVKVQVVIVNGQIDSVDFLEFPDHRSRSREINGRAVPQLTQEAVQAQSAEVDTVSGATDTSDAFIRSLGAALAEASR